MKATNIAPNLSRLRVEKNISQQKLAEMLEAEGVHIHQTHVSAMERGTNMPSVQTLVALAKVLGVTVDELIDEPTITEPVAA